MNPWPICDAVVQVLRVTEDQQLSCAAGARWVAAQLNDGTSVVDAITHLFEAMTANFQRLNEPLFIFEPWFGLGLEILVIPRCASRLAIMADESLLAGISMEAVRLTGAAICAEMRRTGNDLLVHEDDNGTRVLVYHHLARHTVLLATGIRLPEDGWALGRTPPSWRQ
jgi:hypothetical protein